MRYVANCSMLFTELPLLQRPSAAKAAGFEAVEFWWPFESAVPSDAAIDAFVRAIKDAGVALAALNFFAGDMPAGDRGIVSWPARTPEFADNTAVVAGLGRQLDCRLFNALYGNRLDGVEPSSQDETAVANLAAAADALSSIGGTVLVEPLSGAPRYPLRRAADALRVVAAVQERSSGTNVGFLADLYHLAANGEDLDAVIASSVSHFAHVQIADLPGRGEPGSGRLPLTDHLARLHAAGYRGAVGLEYVPTSTTTSSFGWMRPEARP